VAQLVLFEKKPQYELTAEVQQHRDECAKMMANFDAWTSHSRDRYEALCGGMM
jgi:hypothetical protein